VIDCCLSCTPFNATQRNTTIFQYLLSIVIYILLFIVTFILLYHCITGHIFRPLLKEIRRQLEFTSTSTSTSPSDSGSDVEQGTGRPSTTDRSVAHDNNNMDIDERLTTSCSKHHLLLPAFFYALQHLGHSGRDYTIVIRTFGHDLPVVADALAAFQEGRHPMFPLLGHNDRNSKEPIDDDDDADLSFYLPRHHMFRGRYKEQQKEEEDKNNATTNTNTKHTNPLAMDCDGVYQLHGWTDNNTTSNNSNNVNDENLGPVVARNDQEVLAILEGTTASRSSKSSSSSSSKVFGINDDYTYWSQHDCRPECGKPVWVHHNNNNMIQNNDNHVNVNDEIPVDADSNPLLPPLHIFFDDNIKHDPHDSIVAVRQQQQQNGHAGAETETDDAFQYHSLSGRDIQQLQGVHLVRVPTYKPILEVDWFVRQIEACDANYCSRNK
jgi:hypothetical protein